MKKLILLFSTILIVSCSTTAENNSDSNGFGPYDGQSVFLGDQSTVDVFMEIDAAWAARDYDALKGMISDEGRYNFELTCIWLRHHLSYNFLRVPYVFCQMGRGTFQGNKIFSFFYLALF